MKPLEKKEVKSNQRKKSARQSAVQKKCMVLSDAQRGSQVCQFARGEQQQDGSWRTYSSFKSKLPITADQWVVTCYRSNSTPAHRMLALEGHNGSMGWECSEHLHTPDMAQGSQFGNIVRMGLNFMGVNPMKCHPEFRQDLKDKAARGLEMPHDHISLHISSQDGVDLNTKMKEEENKEYDYDARGGDGEQSFNCKTWVKHMHGAFGDNI